MQRITKLFKKTRISDTARPASEPVQIQIDFNEYAEILDKFVLAQSEQQATWEKNLDKYASGETFLAVSASSGRAYCFEKSTRKILLKASTCLVSVVQDIDEKHMLWRWGSKADIESENAKEVSRIQKVIDSLDEGLAKYFSGTFETSFDMLPLLLAIAADRLQAQYVTPINIGCHDHTFFWALWEMEYFPKKIDADDEEFIHSL